jgi:archaellum biogenesis ATPase FlaH
LDNISGPAVIADDRAILSFFASCQRLSSEGKTILVVAQTASFDEHLTRRLHALCNNHISIGTEMFRQKFVNVLQVLKAGNVDLRTDNRITFNVTPEAGITVIPMSRVSA